MRQKTLLATAILGVTCWCAAHIPAALAFDESAMAGERMVAQNAGPAQQSPGAMRQRGGPHAGSAQTMEQLGLSAEQKEQLKTLMQKNRQQQQADRKEIMAKRRQLMQMIHSGSGSKEEALAMHRQIAQQQSAMMEQRIAMIYDIKSVLTPAQFEKFRSMMAQKHKNRMGMHRRGPQGGAMQRPGMRPQGNSSAE